MVVVVCWNVPYLLLNNLLHFENGKLCSGIAQSLIEVTQRYSRYLGASIFVKQSWTS